MRDRQAAQSAITGVSVLPGQRCGRQESPPAQPASPRAPPAVWMANEGTLNVVCGESARRTPLDPRSPKSFPWTHHAPIRKFRILAPTRTVVPNSPISDDSGPASRREGGSSSRRYPAWENRRCRRPPHGTGHDGQRTLALPVMLRCLLCPHSIIRPSEQPATKTLSERSPTHS